MKSNPREFILAFLSEKAANQGIPFPTQESEIAQYDYLFHGVLDSFGIVELISVLETEYSIQFTQDQLASLEFKTIGGLITIVQILSA